jgi:hypothetical protein
MKRARPVLVHGLTDGQHVMVKNHYALTADVWCEVQRDERKLPSSDKGAGTLNAGRAEMACAAPGP